MKPVYALFLAALSGCATVITPSRCETALNGVRTAQEITSILIAHGYAAEVAAKLAQALALGEITLTAACSA